MKLKEKHILLFAGIVLLTAIALVFFMNGRKYGNLVPDASNISGLPEVVRVQIEEATLKVRMKPSAENMGRLGMVYHSSANYDQAAHCYNLAVNRDKKDWTWSYYSGYLHSEMGEPAAAAEQFKRVIEINPNIDLAWYYLGEEYKNLRNNDQAEKAWKRIISEERVPVASKVSVRSDHFPLATYAKFKLARLYFDTGRMEEASEMLKEIIARDYMFGAAYRLLGNIYTVKGETETGEKYITRANDMVAFTSPVDTLADRLAAMSRSELYLLKKIDEAERSIHSDWALKLVNQGMKFLPDNKYLQAKAIKIYLWKRMNDRAIAVAGKHMAASSDDYTGLKNTGLLFYQRTIYQQAVEYWEKALELRSDEPAIWLYMIKSLYALGKKE